MIEIPQHLKNNNLRWDWWYVLDKNTPRGIKKVYIDKKLNKEITEKEYETQRAGGRLNVLAEE